MRKILSALLLVIMALAALGPLVTVSAQTVTEIYLGDLWQVVTLEHGTIYTWENSPTIHYTPPTGEALMGMIIEYERPADAAVFQTIRGSTNIYDQTYGQDVPFIRKCFIDNWNWPIGDTPAEREALAAAWCEEQEAVYTFSGNAWTDAGVDMHFITGWHSGGLGTSTTATIYPILSKQVEPTEPPETDVRCANEGLYRTFDLLTDGELVAGSYESVDGGTDVEPVDTLDFTVELEVPTITQPVMKQGWLVVEVDYANSMDLELNVDIGGTPSTIPNITGFSNMDNPPEESTVSVPGYLTTIPIHVQSEITGFLADQHQSGRPVVIGLWFKVLLSDACQYSQLNDGGMEWEFESPPAMPNPWWMYDPERGYFDRIFNDGYWLLPFLNGGSTCQNGYQLTGEAYMLPVGSEIDQEFIWPGGTAYWKARYRTTNSFFGVSTPTPHIYLLSQGGALYNLFGDGTENYDLHSDEWTLVTGDVYLPAGRYTIYLDHAYHYEGENHSENGRVSYDDVGLGRFPFGQFCDEWVYHLPPEMPTPTPTATGPTPTATVTRTITLGPSPTASRTLSPSQTGLPQTWTPRPTVTRTVTRTPNSSTLTAIAPTRTRTPVGYATKTATPNGTDWSNVTSTVRAYQTLVAGGTQPASVWTPTPVWNLFGGINWPRPGNYDPNPVGTTKSGNYAVDCNVPDQSNGIQWIIPWIDWEVCRILSWVTWPSAVQPTLQAVPTMFAAREPFNTTGQIFASVRMVESRARLYNWADTGVSGVNDPLSPNPSEILSAENPSGPWEAGGTIDLPQSVGNSLTGNSRAIQFSKTCNARVTTAIAARLGEGMCAALNIMREIGYLPWVQLLITLGSIFIAFRAVLSTFQHYGLPAIVHVAATRVSKK